MSAKEWIFFHGLGGLCKTDIPYPTLTIELKHNISSMRTSLWVYGLKRILGHVVHSLLVKLTEIETGINLEFKMN